MATWEYGTLHYLMVEATRSQGLRLPLGRLAGIASVILVLLATAPYWAAQIDLRFGHRTAPSTITVLERPTGIDPRRPQQTHIAGTQAVVPGRVIPTRRSAQARSYVISFGSFGHPRPAEARARLVRSKGYQASVTRVGRSFHVVGHTYRDRTRAEFWSKVFGEIGLATRVLPLGPQTLTNAPTSGFSL